MAASYPSSTKSFTTKTDGPGQTIFAAHVNDLQDEVVAIEAGLRTGLAHNVVPDANNTRDLGASGTKFKDLYLAGTITSPAIATDSTNFIDSPTQPRVSAYNSATQSHASSGSYVAVTFDSEDYDVGGLHDTSSNTDRITIPTGGDGLYHICGQVSFAANVTGGRGMRLTKNGLAFAINPFVVAFSSGGLGPVVPFSIYAVLAAADIIRIEAYQDSGGSLNIGSTSINTTNRLQVTKLW